MIVLLVVLLTAGVINLIQFTKASKDLVISGTPGHVQKTVVAPCAALDVVFVVSLNRPTDTNVTVNYHTADGTARAGTDYTAVSGTLSFSKSSRDRLVCVKVPAVTSTSGQEQLFNLFLSNAVGATLATPALHGRLLAP